MNHKSKCAPIKGDDCDTCIDGDIIKDIAIIFNKKMNANIDINKSPNIIHKDILKILKANNKTSNETVLLSMNTIIGELSKEKLERFTNSFKPKKPIEWKNNKNEWLSNIDIEKVLKQYSEAYPGFHLHGPTAIDFKLKEGNICKVDDLCKFNLKKHLNNKETKLGFVFNTDPHNESGEHWISLYVDCKGENLDVPTIYFFDSTGDSPPTEVEELINIIIEQGKKENINFTYLCNDIQHQTGNTECGIYTIHFIIYMVEGNNFYDYIKNKKSDEYIEKFRNIFFIG
tara:strand:- start:608 stop:1465 length:858 start_codon:yes stop_codon:yes gene_type:complete